MNGHLVRLALPWLPAALAEAKSQSSLPALRTLCEWLGRGTRRSFTSVDWRQWLLTAVTPDAADVLRTSAAGPAVALASGIATPGDLGTWCLAQPVHLAAGLDHLRLAPLRTLALAEDDVRELGATLQAHFGATDFAVAGVVDGAWLLRFPGAVECTAHPPDAAVGHDVHDFMPAGRDGARIRSRGNEIQMLLHDHPVNRRRERAGLLPVSGGWLWGFGVVSAPAAALDLAAWELRVADHWLRALWRGQGGRSAAQAWPLATIERSTLMALDEPPSTTAAESLLRVEREMLQPLAAGLRAGSIARIDLLLGDIEWQVRAADRWRFWRRPARLEAWPS